MLEAVAAPEAPYAGMSSNAVVSPSTSDTKGPSDERPGNAEAARPLENTVMATKPRAPGSGRGDECSRCVEIRAEYDGQQRRPGVGPRSCRRG